MNRCIIAMAGVLGVALLAWPARGEEGFEWQSDRPEARGLDARKLEAWRADLERRGTKGLLVVRDDRIVLEWYGEGFDAKKPHYTASMAKALVGGMSLTIALQDGRLKVDDPAAKFVPQWRGDPKKSKITVGQLATHSSGLEDAEERGLSHEKLTGWKGDFWKRRPDPFTVARDQTPVVSEPGTTYAYSNPGMAMLAYVVTASLRGTAHEDLRTLLRERVMRPIGVGDKEWSIGYGQTYEVDGLKLVANWGGGGFTPRATARVGRLMLRKGDWEGKKVLDREWVDRVLSYGKAPKPAGGAEEDPVATAALGWWTNQDGRMKGVPRDAFWGAGAGGQFLLVVPSLNLIMVRNGSNHYDAKRGETFHGAREKAVFEPLIRAVVGHEQAVGDVEEGPGKSEVIRGVRFAPLGQIRRDAIGSDNWPITWGDDDALYTSFGDGWGFEPRTEKKLSMGWARVEGGAEKFRGVNIRSASGERVGDGAKGAKASGVVMVERVLYAWVRNTGNATLVWSGDKGKTWEWGWTVRESFGTPTFVQFGKNHEGARDEYVYTVSQDGNSAYEPADGVVLARVRKDRIRDRAAWEFYGGPGEGGPRWTKEIRERVPVVRWGGKCERTDVVYDAPLKRYLMTLGFGHGRGWAILDAPEPWGPWTVAFKTDAWDVAETHGYRIPTKWIEPDGKTMWLVFSGRGEYDAFCVRKMTLETVGR